MNIRWLSLVLLSASVLAPRTAAAQPVSDGDKAAARQLTIDGYAALERRDYAGAADLFTRAEALFQAPTVLLGLARARAGLGKLMGAQEAYNRLVHMTLPPDASETFVKAVSDGRRELEALSPRVPSLVIQVHGADAPSITLDGAPVPSAVIGIKRPVDPGQHVIRAVASRFLPAQAVVTLPEGRTETVTLDLVAAPPGTPDATLDATPGGSSGSPRRPVGFALIAVGGAGLVAGAVTAGLTASQRSSLLQKCPTGHCLPSQQMALGPDVDKLHTLAAVSTGGFVAGGVLAAAGVILVATAPSAGPKNVGLAPVVGPGFVGVQGMF
jgi:hypothetical protein